MTNLAGRFAVPPDERTALIIGERRVTYGELGELVGSVRGGFAAAGLVPGDRVAILGGNTEVFVVSYLACISSGLVAVPVNPMAPSAELERELHRCRPSAMVADAVGTTAWLELSAAVRDEVLHVFTSAAAEHPLASYEWAPGVEVDDDHPAALLFTSGTAGTPRPAILTHGNLGSSLDSVLALGLPLAGHAHVALVVVPLYHVMGLHLILDLGFMIGATLVLEDHQSAEQTASLIAEHQVTVVSGPPTLWASLVAADDVDPAQFASVQFAVSGAAPLSPEVAAAVEKRLGITISEGYGLTETSGLVSSALGIDAGHGSVGRPFPGVEVRLVDDNGHDVLIGDPGEVLVRGPMLSPGYLDDPEATNRTRTSDGWLITGDIAVVDDDGMLSIVDRVKDLIIVSGFNVHPAEIEEVLRMHELVEAAAVVGEFDAVTGERPVAHVVRRPADGAGHSERADVEQALMQHCREHLARYKVPARIEFRSSLPTGMGGKLRRSLLTEDTT